MNFKTLLKEKNMMAFLWLQLLYTGITNVVNIFVNTFLLKSAGASSVEVLLYNLIMALVAPFAMTMAIKISDKTNPLISQRLGFLFYAVACIVMSVLGEKIARFYWIFSVFLGFGAAFYFSVYPRQMVSYIEDKKRDVFSGLMTAGSMIISIAVPLLSGYLMSKFGFLGYKIMFGVVAFFAITAIITTKFLAPLIKPEEENNMGVMKVLKIIMKNPKGFKVMLASGIDNCRTFTIAFYITLLIYIAIKDEMMVSFNSVIGSILGILGASVYGIIVNKKRRYVPVEDMVKDWESGKTELSRKSWEKLMKFTQYKL